MKHETTLLWAALVLAGCASSPTTSTADRLKLYQAHSTPVESFQTGRLQGRQVRWQPIDEHSLVVWDESDQPQLLELQEACSGLARAKSISLTNTTGTVTPGSDSVRITAASKAGSATSCRIGSARRIDMDAVKKARAEAKSK
jgi:hypothetical protein